MRVVFSYTGSISEIIVSRAAKSPLINEVALTLCSVALKLTGCIRAGVIFMYLDLEGINIMK